MALGPLQMIGGGAVSVGVGTGVAVAVQPIAQTVANEAWRRHQSMPLAAFEAAQLVASGERDMAWGLDEALNTGISGPRFAALVDMVDAAPDLATLYALWRRGLISAGDFAEGAKKSNLEDKWAAPLAGLHDELLSPAELANARQQEFVTDARLHTEGAAQGFTAERMDLLYAMAGLPPGVETGLMLLRRGIVDESTFREIVAEGHTKTKYTDALLSLADVPLSTAAAVESVIRQRMPLAEGAALAAKHGIDAQTFAQLVDVGGRPPGIVQATSLLNRGAPSPHGGVFSVADFNEVVARSNVRSEYAPSLLALREHFPPLFQLKRMVAAGDVSPAKALEWVHKQGYLDPVWQETITKWAAGTTQGERDLTKAELVALYEGRFVTAVDAQTELARLGYSALEVDQILSLADARRVIRFLNAALQKVHSQFVARKIDESQAVADLDAIGISAAARADVLELWKIELQANVQPLTKGEIGAALRHGVIGTRTAHDRLVAVGVPDLDAQIIVATIAGVGKGPGALPAALP
jgi:hypothetical protein